MQDAAYELPRIHESGSSTSENSVTAKFAEFVFHVLGCVASLDLDKGPQYGSTTNSASGP
jgi:hypothetical protein